MNRWKRHAWHCGLIPVPYLTGILSESAQHFGWAIGMAGCVGAMFLIDAYDRFEK